MTEAPAPEPSTAAIWEDFIDIFYAPSSVFERRRGWSAWPVLLVLTLLLTVLVVVWQRPVGPLLDAEMQRAMAEAMAQDPGIDAEQMDRMGSMGRAFGAIGFAVGFPIGALVLGLVTWGLARLFGAAAQFAAIFGVVVYSQMVRLLEYALGLLQAAVLDVSRYDSIHDVSFNLARFLDQPEASSLAVELAARVDVFTLWATALIAIGLHTVTTLSRGRSAAVAVLVWLLGALPPLAGGVGGIDDGRMMDSRPVLLAGLLAISACASPGGSSAGGSEHPSARRVPASSWRGSTARDYPADGNSLYRPDRYERFNTGTWSITTISAIIPPTSPSWTGRPTWSTSFRHWPAGSAQEAP